MRRANRISGMVLLGFAGIMLIFVLPAQIEQGPAGMMSPRLVPNLMMGALAVLSVVLILTNRALPDAAPDGVPDGMQSGAPDGLAMALTRADLEAVVKLSAVFALTILGFKLAGALLAGVTLVAGSLLALGERRPVVLVLMPAGLLLCLWLVFYKLLGTAIL